MNDVNVTYILAQDWTHNVMCPWWTHFSSPHVDMSNAISQL